MIEKNKASSVFDDIDSLLEVSDIIVRITGTSMWPFFKEGKTKVKLSKINKIKKGKIYLFKNNESHVLHRLIKINGDILTFRGDGNVGVELVKKENLIAELIAYNNGKKEISVNNKFYRFKVFLYKLFPRRVMIKLFKKKYDK